MITREFIQRNHHILFVFGDNDIRKGFGGMAKDFRGEPNSLGVRTKKFPGLDKSHFYTDDEYSINTRKILADINDIINKSINYQYIYFPKQIGLGKAHMKTYCPMTYDYLMVELKYAEVILIEKGKKVVWF